MNKSTHFLYSAVCVAALTVSSNANAVYYDYANEAMNLQTLQGNIQATESSINGTINTMSSNVQEAIRLSTGQLSGNLKETVAASARIADAQDDQEVKRRIQDVKMQASKEAMPSLSRCITTTSAITSSSLSTNTSEVGASMSGSLTDYQRGATDLSKSELSNLKSAAHCQKFASEEDVKSGLCEAAATSPELKNADLDAGRSLFAGKSLNPDQMEASNLLITRIVGSDPWRPMSKDEASTPKGRAEINRRDDIVSKRSVAASALTNLRAANTPVEGAELTAWADARAAATGITRDPKVSGVSENEHLQLQARSWFFDQDWLKSPQGKEEKVILSELLDINAFMAYQNYKNYEQLQQITALLATDLAIRVDQEKARQELANK